MSDTDLTNKDGRARTLQSGVIALACAGLLVAAAGPAGAAPETVWRTGYFTYPGAPVYAEQTRYQPNQRPLWIARKGERVTIDCYSDYFYLVRSPRGDGWTFRDITVEVSRYSKPVWQCSWLDSP